jgi:hypothetical protein
MHRIGQPMATEFAPGILACALAMSMCGATQAQTAGIVRMGVQGEIHLFTSFKLAPKTRVQLQYPGPAGTARCCLSRQGHDFLPDTEDPTAIDSTTGEPLLRYRLAKRLRMATDEIFLGTAMINGRTATRAGANHALLSGTRSGTVTVSSCTGREGLNVMARKGTVKVSDFYLGFGYEIESPTCKPG